MKKQNNKGAILVLVLLISAVIISTCTALLSTTELNYKMKMLNSRVKRAFYAAEGALEEAYVLVEDFIEAGVEYAEINGCSRVAYLNFLQGKCEDDTEHKSLVEVLKDKTSYSIYKECNTTINAEIIDNTDSYRLTIESICIDDKIEEKLKLFCRILIPEDNFPPYSINAVDLICVDDWVLVR